MIRSPDLAAVQAAELRFIAAKQRTADGARHTWEAMKLALARPSSLAVIAAAGFCGGLLAGRSSKRRPAEEERSAEGGSFVSLVLAFALRNAVRLAPVMLSRMWAERRDEEPSTVVRTTVIHDGGAATPTA